MSIGGVSVSMGLVRREGGTRATALTVTLEDLKTSVTSLGVLPIGRGRGMTLKSDL